MTAPNNTEGIGSAFEEKVPGVTAFGIFDATDTRTGKTAWKVDVEQPAKSGLLVAGNLVFFGEGNGKFHAVDFLTGAFLWTFDGTSLPDGGGAQASPIAYEVNGREYVAVCVGTLPAGRGETATPQSPGEYVVFALPAAPASRR